MSEPSERASSQWTETIGLVIFVTIIVVVVGGGLTALATWLHIRNHDPYRGVRLQPGVSYVTSRKWPDVEWGVPAGPYLRWIRAHNGSVALETGEDGAGVLPGKEVTLLIHGYQSPPTLLAEYFKGLIDHLREDVGYQGALVVYDWPSNSTHWDDADVQFARGLSCDGLCRGRIADLIQLNRAGFEVQMYQSDRRAVDQDGAPALAALLEKIQSKLNPSAINIIAHSMGARLTVAALTQHVRHAKLRRLILLAPDLESTFMKDPKVHAAFSTIDAVHVYFSRNDEALSYSEIINRGANLGRQGNSAADDPPTNVHFHDATKRLGQGDAHGRYLVREGAVAISIGDSLK